MKKISLSSIALLIMIMILSTTVTNALAQSQPSIEDVEAKIDALLNEYRSELIYELANGNTAIEVDDGERTLILVGESAKKIELLWLETTKKINALQARPEVQQDRAIAAIQIVEPGVHVTYIEKDKSPYDMTSELEKYQTEKYYYWVEVESNQIVQIDLIDHLISSPSNVYSPIDLETKALSFLQLIVPEVELKKMKSLFTNKENENYFFRWEDPLHKINGQVSSFIQVGFRRDGSLLGYVNTFPLLEKTKSSIITSFNEVYANGGDYWIWRYGSYTTADNAGYCYIFGWCSPKNFYWTYTTNGTATAKGVWAPNPNTTVKVAAFIPGTNATTIQACYTIKYNGGASLYNRCIIQNDYYDTWVVINTPNLYSVTKVFLVNSTDGESGRKVAWDEIWVYTP
jgi:hypothetical protein